MDGQEALQQGGKVGQIQRVRAIGFGIGGIVMNLEEDTVHPRRDRCPRQNRDEFRLAALLAARGGWRLYRMGPVEDHGSYLPHDG